MNSFVEQNIAKNIVLNALKQFFKTLKKKFFERQLKIFFITQKMFEIQISKIRFVTKLSNFVFIKKMRKLTKNDIHFDEMSFNFRIIVIILQKIDHLIKKKMTFCCFVSNEKAKKKTFRKTKNLNRNNDKLLTKYCIMKTKCTYLLMRFKKNYYDCIMMIRKSNISIMKKF